MITEDIIMNTKERQFYIDQLNKLLDQLPDDVANVGIVDLKVELTQGDGGVKIYGAEIVYDDLGEPFVEETYIRP